MTVAHPLFLRPCVIAGETAPDDYSVVEDGKIVGRVYRDTGNRAEAWVWSVTIGIPSTAYGRSPSRDQAKADFRAAFDQLKATTDPEKLAKALAGLSPYRGPGQ